MKLWSEARRLARATASKYATGPDDFLACHYCGGDNNLFVRALCSEIKRAFPGLDQMLLG